MNYFAQFFSPDFGEVIFFTHIFSLGFLRLVILLTHLPLRFSEVSYFAPIFLLDFGEVIFYSHICGLAFLR